MDLLVVSRNNDYGCCRSIQVLSLCCFWNISHRIRWAKDNKENSKRNFIVTSNHINKWKTINQQPFWGSAHKHLFTNYINANMWRAPGGRNREIDRRHTPTASLFDRCAIEMFGIGTRIFPFTWIIRRLNDDSSFRNNGRREIQKHKKIGQKISVSYLVRFTIENYIVVSLKSSLSAS